MGRELKRVPMDFGWPQGKIWWGYQITVPCQHAGGHLDEYKCCPLCGERPSGDHRQIAMPQIDPPEGEGYQLWETTSEGSPESPVFATLDELCAWCEGNATTFADYRATAEEWRAMLSDGLVFAQSGCMTFI